MKASTLRPTTVGLALLALLCAMFPGRAAAVVLDDENRLNVVLSGGTEVVLYAQAGARPGQSTNRYYYLPANLRLAQSPDGTPEFLFLKFTTEERGKASGGIIHMLITWGLTPEQESELRTKLDAEHDGAELMGSVPMLPMGESGSFQVVSATLQDEEFSPTLVTSGKAPLLPGGKAAAASRLTADGAQLLGATFEQARSIADASIVLNFAYSTLTPAARGRIIFDWSKYEREYDSFEAEYKKWVSGRKTKKVWGVTWSSKPTYSYSYDEMRAHYDFLLEKQVVRLEFDELVADERVAKIRDAFFQFFLDSFAEPADPEDDQPPPPSDDEQDASPDIRYGNSYRFTKTFHERSFKRKVQRFDLNYRMAIQWPFQLVGNLASWYDGVRDNPRCVASVNLNDPFFQHRDIHFILDLDAKEMFDEAINYVTVNVRKARSGGRDFEDHVTLDANFVRDNGITASVTYARGEDTNPDVYEYQAQWSLRGGSLFPEDPPWQQGSWEGVTLSPPVVPRTLELEGDLEELKESGITRVTAQVRYWRFGREVEDNVQLSARGEPLVQKQLFMDRGSNGYAYRLVFNHRREGKLALPWTAQVGDNYIYASIPEQLLQEPSAMNEAKVAAADVARDAAKNVLDRFKELLPKGSEE